MHFVLKTHCLNVFRKADGAMTRDWNRKKKRRRIFCLSEQAENNPVGFRECAHNMYTQHRNSTLQLMDTGHISFIELFFLKLKIITFIGRDCEPQPNPIWKWLNYQSVQQKKTPKKLNAGSCTSQSAHSTTILDHICLVKATNISNSVSQVCDSYFLISLMPKLWFVIHGTPSDAREKLSNPQWPVKWSSCLTLQKIC